MRSLINIPGIVEALKKIDTPDGEQHHEDSVTVRCFVSGILLMGVCVLLLWKVETNSAIQPEHIPMMTMLSLTPAAIGMLLIVISFIRTSRSPPLP
ncbi:MAG TPA: hypothetical protein QF873_00580 [Patescibacteria group bacterium]|nr:hypothetical protein [Patescibacteria group bacterium]